MNIYHALNEVISYIEQNLDQPISYTKLAQFLGVNEYTMQSLFSLLCNISLSDYIRKRRLSEAGFYLYKNNSKIIDVALQYQYENPTSFSRAFEKFHGIKPSQVKNNPKKLKLYPKLHFDETITDENEKIEYSIIEKEELILYGKGFKTTQENIQKEAPIFFRKMYEKYAPKYGEIDYGMTVYEKRLESNQFEYWILYQRKIPGFTKYVIPKSKWLCFHIPSFECNMVQEMTQKFYLSFLPIRVSKADAMVLESNMHMNVAVRNSYRIKLKMLTELKNRECIVRISSNGVPLPAFKAKTLDFTPFPKRRMNQILRASPLLKEFKPVVQETKGLSFQIGESVDSLMNLMYSQSTGRKQVENHG